LTLSDLTAYATILGTGIALGALGFGAWTWRREHGTNVTVQISIGFLAFPPNIVDAVMVTVYNESAHPVRVTGAGVEINDGGKRAGHVSLKPGATIPGTIPPHDQGMTWLETAELVKKGFDVYRKARAFAILANRAVGPLWSKRRTLMRRN
jgi:hypothetical protein